MWRTTQENRNSPETVATSTTTTSLPEEFNKQTPILLTTNGTISRNTWDSH
ncbi:C4 protein [Caenorhabditis elegans]|uniref:C4 protein n=1 Tax=Caenorhabditis elegans TaxID=6239 RepID=D3KZH0_CAEEL|nr:C4 protein [Caenorhabditis elegans]CCD71969.1 C4 protein [Caenorhabditis elegans]|eukprot:NP_001255253.1 Uncharacterized protein CELE_Y46C8AL.11 [Caenorhabditis elegans]